MKFSGVALALSHSMSPLFSLSAPLPPAWHSPAVSLGTHSLVHCRILLRRVFSCEEARTSVSVSPLSNQLSSAFTLSPGLLARQVYLPPFILLSFLLFSPFPTCYLQRHYRPEAKEKEKCASF